MNENETIPGAGPGRARDEKGKSLNVKVNERELSINYAIVKLKGTNKAFKTVERPDGRIFIKGDASRNQLWLTLRVPVKDEWAGIPGFLDVDMYLPNTSENRRKLQAWILESANMGA